MQDHKPGPHTIPGKAISSRNALRHGCCADTLILKNENIEDYKALEAIWFESYLPADEAETHLVQELVNADWFLQRATRTVTQIEAQLLDENPNPLNWTDQQQHTFTRFLRYQTTRANAVTRSRKAVEHYRNARAAELKAIEKSHTAEQRLEVFKEKNKPEQTIQEIIQDMVAKKAERDRLAGLNEPETL